MKLSLVFAVLLVCASVANADNIQDLRGITRGQGYTFVYDFQVDTTTFTFFNVITGLPDIGIAAILNGTLIETNKHIGCTPCTAIFFNDVYEHTPYETQIMWEWGPFIDSNYDQEWSLVSGLGTSGAYVVDPVATSEPMTIVLIVVGGLYFWALSIKPRKAPRGTRNYVGHHTFRKG